MTILIIDDDRNDCNLLNEAVKMIDPAIECIMATDSEKALALLNDAKVKPELIIADLIMPKIDGLQFYYTIKASPALQSIPIIFISSDINETDMFFFSRAGINVLIRQRDSSLLISPLRCIFKNLTVKDSSTDSNLLLTSLNTLALDNYKIDTSFLQSPALFFKRLVPFLSK